MISWTLSWSWLVENSPWLFLRAQILIPVHTAKSIAKKLHALRDSIHYNSQILALMSSPTNIFCGCWVLTHCWSRFSRIVQGYWWIWAFAIFMALFGLAPLCDGTMKARSSKLFGAKEKKPEYTGSPCTALSPTVETYVSRRSHRPTWVLRSQR